MCSTWLGEFIDDNTLIWPLSSIEHTYSHIFWLESRLINNDTIWKLFLKKYDSTAGIESVYESWRHLGFPVGKGKLCTALGQGKIEVKKWEKYIPREELERKLQWKFYRRKKDNVDWPRGCWHPATSTDTTRPHSQEPEEVLALENEMRAGCRSLYHWQYSWSDWQSTLSLSPAWGLKGDRVLT